MTTAEEKAIVSKNCMNTLRSQLYLVLDKNNCTQAELAEVCGISLRSVNNIFNRRQSNIELDTLVSISVGTGIPLVNLIDAKGQEWIDNIQLMKTLYADLEVFLKKGGAL